MHLLQNNNLKINWQFTCMNTKSNRMIVVMRDNVLRVQKETITRKTKNGLGSSRTWYYVDGYDGDFRNENDLLNFLEGLK